MATTAPTPTAEKASSQAVTSLVLGVLGLACCQILAPVAWYLGNQELKSIREGRSSAAGKGVATAGMVLGLIGTLFVLLGLVWVFAFGGLAILGAFMEAAG